MGIELKIKHRNCKLDLKLEHKITVIVGSSATGKSTIHRALTDGDATAQVKVSNNSYQIEYLPNKQYADNLLDHTGTFKGYRIYIIDEGKLDIDNSIAKAIQFSKNIYVIITSRTKLYNLNFDLFAVKELYTQEDGVTVLKNYIHTAKKVNTN